MATGACRSRFPIYSLGRRGCWGNACNSASNTPERRAVIELSAGRPEIRMPADDSAVAGTVVRTRSLEPLAHAIGVVQGALGC